MRRNLLVAAALFLPLLAGGCSWPWQANNASQAVDVNPWLLGSGQSVFSPANGPGYVGGDAMDMRSRR